MIGDEHPEPEFQMYEILPEHITKKRPRIPSWQECLDEEQIQYNYDVYEYYGIPGNPETDARRFYSAAIHEAQRCARTDEEYRQIVENIIAQIDEKLNDLCWLEQLVHMLHEEAKQRLEEFHVIWPEDVKPSVRLAQKLIGKAKK